MIFGFYSSLGAGQGTRWLRVDHRFWKLISRTLCHPLKVLLNVLRVNILNVVLNAYPQLVDREHYCHHSDVYAQKAQA